VNLIISCVHCPSKPFVEISINYTAIENDVTTADILSIFQDTAAVLDVVVPV